DAASHVVRKRRHACRRLGFSDTPTFVMFKEVLLSGGLGTHLIKIPASDFPGHQDAAVCASLLDDIASPITTVGFLVAGALSHFNELFIEVVLIFGDGAASVRHLSNEPLHRMFIRSDVAEGVDFTAESVPGLERPSIH